MSSAHCLQITETLRWFSQVMIAIHLGMPMCNLSSLRAWSISLSLSWPVQGTATLSSGILSITGELQICSRSFNTERCYYHLETFIENEAVFESCWLLSGCSDLLTDWAYFAGELQAVGKKASSSHIQALQRDFVRTRFPLCLSSLCTEQLAWTIQQGLWQFCFPCIFEYTRCLHAARKKAVSSMLRNCN